jgi:tetratricopeptide (TPR) repeat protein
MVDCPLRPKARVSAFLAAALLCALFKPAAADDPEPKEKPRLQAGPSITDSAKKKDSDKPSGESTGKSGPEAADAEAVDPDIQADLDYIDSLLSGGQAGNEATTRPESDDVPVGALPTWAGFGPTINSFVAPPEPEAGANKDNTKSDPQASARTQKKPPSARTQEILGRFVESDKRIQAAPPERREEVIREEIPKLKDSLDGERPPEVPPTVYNRALVEVGRALNRLGGHESTAKAQSQELYQGSHDLARRVIENTPEKDGEEFRDALNLSARSNLGLGRYQPAINDATTAARLKDDDQRAYTTRALAYYQMGNYNQAMEDAKRALRLNPNNATAFKIQKLSRNRLTTPKDLKLDRMARAAAEQIDREYDAMEEERSEAEKILPETAIASASGSRDRFVDSLNTQALTYTRSGKHQAAYDAYTKALARDPNNQTARQQRGRTATIIGRYQEAVQDASALLEGDPDNFDALLMRARAFTQLGRFQEAKRDADRAVGIDSKSATAYKVRGLAKENLGDLPGMIADFRRAAALDPATREELRATATRYGFRLDGSKPITGATPAPDARRPAPKDEKSGQRRRFLIVLASSISGGLLIAIGVLQLFVGGRRERRRKAASIENAGEETKQALDAGGELQGGFKILRVLGNGGMGIVYEAQDKALDRKVAIKKMREEIQQDERERARFLQEARLVAKMHHPNIVDIHSIVEDDGELYLVFEHVEGETLDQVMNRKQRLSVKEAQYIFRGVCHALEYAHQKAVIHRDLKPSNIMITTEGRVKVMDFGIARQAKDALLKSTKTNHVAGTPQYMAPEQEEGTVRVESDIFSLGACLYEVLTGERPYDGPSTTASKMNKRYTRAARVRKELPAEIDKLIDDALEPDPDRRVRSVAEFRARLEAIAAPSQAV